MVYIVQLDRKRNDLSRKLTRKDWRMIVEFKSTFVAPACSVLVRRKHGQELWCINFKPFSSVKEPPAPNPGTPTVEYIVNLFGIFGVWKLPH